MIQDSQAWLETLQGAAPRAPWLLLRPLSLILAGPAGPDTLLIVADALDEAAKEAALRELPDTIAAWPRKLAEVLREEAPLRA